MQSQPEDTGPAITGLPSAIERVLASAAQRGASDIHLAPNQPPWVRHGGEFKPEAGEAPLSAEVVAACGQWAGGTDVSITRVAAQCRWRVTAYTTADGWRVSFRVIPSRPPAFEQLGLPDEVRALAALEDGLIITAGATGSGKTTTLAALIALIVRSRPIHLLTIEEPLEYQYESAVALVTHRELGMDGLKPETALATAMRSDPDIVLFGEMRRPEDFHLCMELASSGHLVLTTLHARDSGTVCERITAATGVGGRSVLAQVLRAIIVQKLVPAAQDPRIRYVAAEVLMMDPSMRSIIRPGGQLTRIESTLTNQRRTLDVALANLVREGKITKAVGEAAALNPAFYASELSGRSPTQGGHGP